jgi:hypothetical protein
MIIRVGIETVGPIRANGLLRNNKANRKFHQEDADKFAKIILAGDWQTHHQGILIGRDGSLLDGQHRLTGVVQADKEVQIVVAYDDTLTEPLGLDCDSGRKRSLNWTHGIPKRESEVARILISLVANNYDGTNCKVPGNTAPREIKVMSEAISKDHGLLASTIRTCFSSAPIRAAAILAMTDENKEEIAVQYKLLVNHTQEGMWPILLGFEKELTKRLEKIPGGGLGTSDLFARAYKAFTGDRGMTRLRLGTRGTPTRADIMSKIQEAAKLANKRFGWLLKK